MSKELSPLEVRGVLLPLHTGQLLIPNNNLCEVIGYRPPEKGPESYPDWLLGIVPWRQRQVPVVCFDALMGSPVDSVGQRARIAMCYSLQDNATKPFIGILLRSIPHLVRVMETLITPIGEPGEFGPMIAGQVRIGGQEAWIPDFDRLELALGETLQPS